MSLFSHDEQPDREQIVRDIYNDLGIKEPVKKHLEGLEDGGKVLFTCSTCDRGLAEVWITRPSEPEQYTAYAKCPYCKGEEARSYEKTWKGGFHIGGYLDETVIQEIIWDQHPMVIFVAKKSG